METAIQTSKYQLIDIPDQSIPEVVADDTKGGSGYFDGCEEARKLFPLPKFAGRGKYDHCHLSKTDETNFIAWYGRTFNGYHYRISNYKEWRPI